ncbi:MAG TPA: helix-turn-helix transcriptional regulator [Actinomycetota bacterium]|nr:helix-turn-helix transcriptional regulator [Actinomycetota bacterium]
MSEHDDLAGGQPRNFLRPCLLLLLLEGPAHGYDLLERLRDFGFGKSDPGGVYRTLRALEREGLVHSTWETSSTGPARRIYTITPEGEDQLGAWAAAVNDSRRTLEQFLERFAVATGQSVGDGLRGRARR